MQYLCKNFPALREFNTPYLRWRCAEREYYNPVWGTQFTFDGVECHPMTGTRPTTPLSPPCRSWRRPSTRPSSSRRRTPMAAALAALLRRAHGGTCRCSCSSSPSARTRRAARGSAPPGSRLSGTARTCRASPSRYVYVQARRARPPGRRASGSPAAAGNGGGAAAAAAMGALQERLAALDDEYVDRVVGDTVTLSAVREGTTASCTRCSPRCAGRSTTRRSRRSSRRTTTRWYTSAGCGSGSATSGRGVPAHRPPAVRVYAGRIFPRSQVIRANFTKADLWSPAWFPADFVKWSVSFDAYAGEAYPPYAGGGGCVLGREVVEKVVAGYDAGRGARLPRRGRLHRRAREAARCAHADGDVPGPPRGSRRPQTFIDERSSTASSSRRRRSDG